MTEEVQKEEVVEQDNTFFVIKIDTGEEVIQFRTKDASKESGETAVNIANKATEERRYSMKIDNGIRVVPVKAAEVIGPCEEKPAE